LIDDAIARLGRVDLLVANAGVYVRKRPWETTVSEQCEKNVHVKKGVTEDEFVAMRSKRDATLSAPRLLLPSIQVNIRAGKFPPKENNGVRYLLIPVRPKGGAEAYV
jgi:hypothetical protein